MIAMLSMLIDHTSKTVVENDSFISVLGRLAFPIFAFMVAEGYFRTHNYRKYFSRMLFFAILSEIPYDLMKSGEAFDLCDQNVLWTFLIALLCIRGIDMVKTRGKRWLSILVSIFITFFGFLLGTVLLTDYGGMGVLMALIFYFYPKRSWSSMLVQFILLFIINVFFLGGLGYGVMVNILGMQMEFPQQGFAIFALIPIWLYRGRQGYHSKPFQYICYAFYPVHMLILGVAAHYL
jgi:hypothetical protein